MFGLVGIELPRRLEGLSRVWLDSADRVAEEHLSRGGQVMIQSLIIALGLTFFPGQPHWYELDTRGVEWTVTETVLLPESGFEAIAATSDSDSMRYMHSLVRRHLDNVYIASTTGEKT